MANICSNYMTITGDQTQLNDLLDKIVAQDAGLINIFTWFESQNKPGNAYGLIQDPEELANDKPGEFISLDYTCKWGPPVEDLLALSGAYPKLVFDNKYEESGMGIYGNATYENGVCTLDHAQTPEEYWMDDEEFGSLIQDINTVPYKKFLKEYIPALETLSDDDPSFRAPEIVEKYILKRMENKDLPLLINHDWLSDKNQKEFETRLKGG